MLHGASGILAIRSPLLFSHMFVASHPWIPDMLKATQAGGGIFFPPIFYESGIGLPASDVVKAREQLEQLKAGLAGPQV
jgi:hypothetical protein